MHRAQAAALATARPGVECGAVDAAARKVITDAGYGPDYKYFTHRLGHGMGMDGHEWPYLVRGNTTKLQANMTFSDEPGIYIPRRIRRPPRRRHARHRKRRGAIHPAKPVARRSLRKTDNRATPSYFPDSTRKLLVTENIPGTPFARMPAKFLSPSLSTTPSSVTCPFFTIMRIGFCTPIAYFSSAGYP